MLLILAFAIYHVASEFPPLVTACAISACIAFLMWENITDSAKELNIHILPADFWVVFFTITIAGSVTGAATIAGGRLSGLVFGGLTLPIIFAGGIFARWSFIQFERLLIRVTTEKT